MSNRCAMTILLVLVACITKTLAAQPATCDADRAFIEQVHLVLLDRVAVHTQGRVKSFDSHARSVLKYITGSRSIDGQSPTFTYLDLMLRPERYESKDIIYVKNKLVRASIAASVEETYGPEWKDRFTGSGLISPLILGDPRVRAVMSDLSADLIKTARYVEAIQQAQFTYRPEYLRMTLRIVASPTGDLDDQWYTLDDLIASEDSGSGLVVSMPADLSASLIEAWGAFTTAWRSGDASGVNSAASQLAQLLPTVNTDPAVYPASTRLAWESWYFKNKNMTWVWLIYAISLVPLLVFVAFRFGVARIAGLLLFFTAFGFHTFAVLLRWYVSGRWPNANMFEAITTAAWFGGCFAVVFELFARRSPVRGLAALGSAAASMTAMMATRLYPLELDPNISNMMPVLHDLWLYIHTNVIIFSYALIFMAAISAVLYLLYRAGKALKGERGVNDYARVGGAASLIMTTPDGGTYLNRAKTTTGHLLDGTTMILLELSFILLWAGIVMGAIWADHSWGRPWGWDPKEVFALNTFIIFVLLIHTRMTVKDKGLWTALLAILGCVVMLFNWVIINFAIAGLHSYA